MLFNQFDKTVTENYLPVAVILKMRPIIKVWVRFLTRACTQTFLEKDLSKLLFRAIADMLRARDGSMGKSGEI